MVQTLVGTDNSTKGKKATIHHTKQPQLSVRVSMIESLNEEIEIKLSSLQRTEKTSDPGMFALWGHLTECYWQNGCFMWRMRAAVGILDRGE